MRAALTTLLPALALTTAACRGDRAPQPRPPTRVEAPTPRWFSDPADPASAATRVDAPCRDCHTRIFDAWTASQHAVAQQPGVAVGLGAPADAVAVIGVAPLQQLLVPGPHGAFQVHDPARDVRDGSWFSVYATPPRPGDWNHPDGGGMRWNAQCAACHTTGFEKRFDPGTQRLSSRWHAAGVGCAACHGDIGPHGAGFDARAAGAASCVPCHARGEPLAAGGSTAVMDDATRLFLADTPGLFGADGSATDEVFEVGSLALSAMGQAGVTCLDCHDPHSGQTLATVDDNSICLTCHAGAGRLAAPRIDPGHSRHAAGTVADRCVSCHMPERTYMQRDRRRDHQFGVPMPEWAPPGNDPCTGCHTERDTSWAVEALGRWYPARTQRLAWRRAELWTRLAASPSVGTAEAAELARWLESEPNDAWRASWVGAFRGPATVAAAMRLLDDPAPVVRAAAARALAGTAEARPRLVALREDPTRLVRLAAAWSTRTTLPPASAAARELEAWLALSSDDPAGAIRLSEWALVRQKPAEAVTWAEYAVAAQPSTGAWHTLARALHAAGRAADADDALRRARSLAAPAP